MAAVSNMGSLFKKCSDVEGCNRVRNHLDSILSVSEVAGPLSHLATWHAFTPLPPQKSSNNKWFSISCLLWSSSLAQRISERGLIINTLIPVELSDIYSAVSGEPQSFEFCFVSGTACAQQKPATRGHTGLLCMWQSEQRLV